MDLNKLDLNVNQLVRSVVVLLVGAPISLSILAQAPERTRTSELDRLKTELEVPCLRYMTTKADSKGERAAMDAVDEVYGTDPAYSEVCKWALS